MLIQEQSIHSLDLSELDLDGEKGEMKAEETEHTESHMKEEAEEEVEVKKVGAKEKLSIPIKEENTFDKFLDVMEVF